MVEIPDKYIDHFDLREHIPIENVNYDLGVYDAHERGYREKHGVVVDDVHGGDGDRVEKWEMVSKIFHSSKF